MAKLIRATYPAGFSIGLLILIFVLSFFLSHQIFDVSVYDIHETKGIYFGMFLVGMAVVIMLLILWEEILFPIKVQKVKGGLIFRNHRTKLKTQLFIYCSIPAIFTFIYLEYEVNHIRFFICAAICIIAPLAEKIFSGLKNFNDFLVFTSEKIEYKDNEKEGSFNMKDIQNIIIIKDERSVLYKIQLVFHNHDNVIINLYEMELEAYYPFIYEYITVHYKHLAKEIQITETEK